MRKFVYEFKDGKLSTPVTEEYVKTTGQTNYQLYELVPRKIETKTVTTTEIV